MPSPRKPRLISLVLVLAACVLCPPSTGLAFRAARRTHRPGKPAGEAAAAKSAMAASPDRRDGGAPSAVSRAASRPGRRVLARARPGRVRRGSRDATRLNYRDLDDGDLVRIASGAPREAGRGMLRRGGILRRIRERRRRRLAKVLFPPADEDGEGSDSGATPEPTPSVEESRPVIAVDEPVPAVQPARRSGRRKGIKLRKKAKPRIEVSSLDELRSALLDDGAELRNIDLTYTIPPSLRATVRREGAAATDNAGDSRDEVLFSELQLPAVLRANEYTPAEYAGGGTHHIEFTNELSDLEFFVDGDDEPMDAAEMQLVGNVLAENALGLDDQAWDEGHVDDEQEPLFSHDVLNVLRRRYETRSAPGARDEDDEAVLALSIEGGGMRGAGECGRR